MSNAFLWFRHLSVRPNDGRCKQTGNEEWIGDLQTGGIISEREPWRPWFTAATPSMPAGYVTTYNVTGGAQPLTFLTIRLAGHMVPMFQPEPALTFFERFLAAKPQ